MRRPNSPDSAERYERNREKIRAMLAAGEMEQRTVELTTEQKAVADDARRHRAWSRWISTSKACSRRSCPRTRRRREMTVAEARQVLFEQECDALINQDKVNAMAIELAENTGHRSSSTRSTRWWPASRRTGPTSPARACSAICLPIVEGTTVQTRYGYVKHGPHPVHRGRRVSPQQAERPDAGVAGAIPHSRRVDAI